MKKKILKIVIVITFIIMLITISIYILNKLYVTTIIIGNQTVVIDIKTDKIINLKTLQSEKDLIIKKEGITKVTVNNQELENELNLGKIIINKDEKIKIDITYFGITKTYYINTLPSNFPEYEVQGESEYEGDYYLTTYNNLIEPYYLFKLDEKGNIKYYKETENVTFDFKKVKVNGKEIYTYLEVVKGEMDPSNKSYCSTKLVLMDENYNEVEEVRYKNEDGTIQPLENHQSLILGENHYILATFEELEIDNNISKDIKSEKVKVVNNKIEEIKDGEILWEFETMDYPELFKYSEIDLDLTRDMAYSDCIHYNSCDIDKTDGNLLCSFRNISSILKINRKTGELMWILGGKGDEFNLTEEQKFEKQHAVTSLDDGNIIIFDNGNGIEKSRIIKLKIDEKNKKLINYEGIEIETNSSFMGSAQPIDKNSDIYVICYGGGLFEHNLLEELNLYTGEIYFSFNLKNSKYLFRVYKIK